MTLTVFIVEAESECLDEDRGGGKRAWSCECVRRLFVAGEKWSDVVGLSRHLARRLAYAEAGEQTSSVSTFPRQKLNIHESYPSRWQSARVNRHSYCSIFQDSHTSALVH